MQVNRTANNDRLRRMPGKAEPQICRFRQHMVERMGSYMRRAAGSHVMRHCYDNAYLHKHFGKRRSILKFFCQRLKRGREAVLFLTTHECASLRIAVGVHVKHIYMRCV